MEEVGSGSALKGSEGWRQRERVLQEGKLPPSPSTLEELLGAARTKHYPGLCWHGEKLSIPATRPRVRTRADHSKSSATDKCECMFKVFH